jgi:nitrite reductase/ring-hydroxylating ferredoxin subunit
MEVHRQADRFEGMTVLCRLDEISEPGSAGFLIEADGKDPREIFVVRKDGQVYGYENRCPHAGVPLAGGANNFLAPSNTLIQCGLHGALFGIEDGLCVAGPCRGKSLTKLRVRIVAGELECPAIVWDDE